MFKISRKNSHNSDSNFSSCDTISINSIQIKDDCPHLLKNSKKRKRKNFFNILRQKFSSVFQNGRQDSLQFHSSSKGFCSKSLEVLTTNTFKEPELNQEETIETEHFSSGVCVKDAQSIRSRETFCPEVYSVHMGNATNSTRTSYQHGDLAEKKTTNNTMEEKEKKSSKSCHEKSSKADINCNKADGHSSSCEKGNSICDTKEGISQNSLETTNNASTLIKKPVHPLSSQSKDFPLDMSLFLKKGGEASSLTPCDEVKNPILDIKDEENKCLVKEIRELSKYGWYWGPLHRNEAEDKLYDQADGAFLVRDSSDDRYLLSLSFRSFGKTLHTRIEHSMGRFSFYPQPGHDSHGSLVGLINHCISESDEGVFCYSRPLIKGSPSFPVRLTKPVSRFMQDRSLQYLCRFVIRQYTNIHHIQTLPLPPKIKKYLEESYY